MDVVWYWRDGVWFAVFDLYDRSSRQVALALRADGFVAREGSQAQGAPQGPPTDADFRSLLSPSG